MRIITRLAAILHDSACRESQLIKATAISRGSYCGPGLRKSRTLGESSNRRTMAANPFLLTVLCLLAGAWFPAKAQTDEILVSAAISLKESFNEIGRRSSVPAAYWS